MTDSLDNDLLEGAQAIAEFLWGASADVRRIYRLQRKHQLPTFRIGDRICARRSSLMRLIELQERGMTPREAMRALENSRVLGGGGSSGGTHDPGISLGEQILHGVRTLDSESPSIQNIESEQAVSVAAHPISRESR